MPNAWGAGATGRAIVGLARRYVQQGLIYVATELYKRVMREYAGTPESREAQQGLLEIAHQHEASGRQRLALALYDTLQESGAKGVDDITDGQETVPGDEGKNRTGLATLMAEAPFVDLMEHVSIIQNFERLGQEHRRAVEITRWVKALKGLSAQPDHGS